jgi:hypothetical protein
MFPATKLLLNIVASHSCRLGILLSALLTARHKSFEQFLLPRFVSARIEMNELKMVREDTNHGEGLWTNLELGYTLLLAKDRTQVSYDGYDLNCFR